MSKQSVKFEDLIEIEPITVNQVKAFDAWSDRDHLVLAGSAGTGKTFIALYLALQSVLEPYTSFNKVVLVRSVVPTREVGYLPGDIGEKVEPFEAPYKNICLELFSDTNSTYNKLINSHQMVFNTTSFIRGITIDLSLIHI